jgi:hypothetical protein
LLDHEPLRNQDAGLQRRGAERGRVQIGRAGREKIGQAVVAAGDDQNDRVESAGECADGPTELRCSHIRQRILEHNQRRRLLGHGHEGQSGVGGHDPLVTARSQQFTDQCFPIGVDPNQ